MKTSDAEVSALLATSSAAAAADVDATSTTPAAPGETAKETVKSAGERILFVVNNASFFESHRLSVAQHAQSLGYEVGLCTGREASPTLALHALPKLAQAGLTPKRVSFRSSGVNPVLELIGFIQLVWFVRKFRPTLVHCASPKGVLYGGLAARLTGVPAVVLAVSGMGYAYTGGHASTSRRWAKAAYERLSKWAYGHPNKRVIVQNEDDAAAVTARGLAKRSEVRLIAGSGVVLDDFVHLPLQGREPLVLLPARMLRDKGVVEFVEAAKRLRKHAPQWRFVLVGTADYDNPSAISRALIEQWQRDGDINWMGHVSDPKAMVALYARAAIVCLPSYREGMPRVLLEAAAAGCAVVTTDAIGCRDAIDPGVTGDLVPVGNSAALADVLLALMRDPERRSRYGQAGRVRAQKLFGLGAVHNNTMAVYRELLAPRAPQSGHVHEATTASRLMLVQLNELSFDVVQPYIARLGLKSFPRLMSGHFIATQAEAQYELLEPWIQWPSVYNGQTAAEHGLMRLGDAIGHSSPQIFELLEQRGVSVGCVAAFSAENRMQRPAYFIPDPWTATHSDPSWWSRVLSAAISQMVNDNSQQRATLKSLLHLSLGVMRFARPCHYDLYLKLAATAKGAPWRKALFLDVLLHDMHWRLFHAKGAQFSTVFLNAGAHIQHHYLRNARAVPQGGAANPASYVSADVDPVAEMLSVYDRLLADYLALPASNTGAIIATGLSQQPFEAEKYYWRLRNHTQFLNAMGIAHRAVMPRMSRDFLIEFATADAASQAQQTLSQLRVTPRGEALFGVIDNRGDSLFVTLTYPHAVTEDDAVEGGLCRCALAPEVAMVALKNGMHRSLGHAYFSADVAALAPADGSHVKNLHESIQGFFDKPAPLPSASAFTSATASLARTQSASLRHGA